MRPNRFRTSPPAVAGVFLAACLATLPLAPAPAAAGQAGVYGEGVELEQATPIADILADPDAFVGKTVRIEGGVLDVCPRKGCWIQVGDEAASLQVKVEDDVIVFPADARGRLAAAQGVVEAVEMSRESYLAWLAHRAEEKGEAFDPETAEPGPGPYRMIRLRGTGARLTDRPAAG